MPVTSAGLVPELKARVDAMLAEANGKLWLNSALRTYQEQVVLYNRYLSGRGPLAAKPGTSNHERGLAVDIGGDNATRVALTKKYGLKRTVSSEAWHYELDPARKPFAAPAAPITGGLPVVADIIPNIVDSCPAPEGGVWTLARDGGVACSQGAPMFGSYPGLKAKYRTAERYFVSIHARGKSNSDGYKIISNGGEAYDFHPGMQGDLGAQ